MSVRLKVVEGKPFGAVVALHGKWFYIGRDPSCQLRPKNEAVGDRHCALFLDGDHVEVKDLGSSTGTVLNGRKLKPSISTPLHHGDRLQVGPLTFEVEVNRSAEGEHGKGRETPMGGLDDDDESSLTAKIANRLIQRELGSGADPTKAVGAHLQTIVTEGIPCVTIAMTRVAEQMVPVLKKELANLAERPALTRLILDLRQVAEIDRPGIELLRAFEQKLKSRGTRLKLCEINPDVMDKLAEANVIDQLPIFLDCHDAIWSAW